MRFTPLATTQLDWADRWWEHTLSVKTTEEQLQAAVNILSQVWLASDRTPLALTDHLTHTHKCNEEMIQPAVNPFLLSLTVSSTSFLLSGEKVSCVSWTTPSLITQTGALTHSEDPAGQSYPLHRSQVGCEIMLISMRVPCNYCYMLICNYLHRDVCLSKLCNIQKQSLLRSRVWIAASCR